MTEWGKFEVNEEGNMVIAGCDAVALASEFGTPLYVMEEDKIRAACRSFKRTIGQHTKKGIALYASKAFLNMAMCKIIEEEGLGLDVVSGGELFTAVKAGFPVEKIYMHGNNKTEADLKMAVNVGIGCIVLDNHPEIAILNDIAKAADRKVAVSIRIKPGIEAHTHEYIRTGQVDSKFGFDIDNGDADRAVQEVLSASHLKMNGIHCHIGSQVFDLQPFTDTVDRMMGFLKKTKERTGYLIEEINFGGGYGIHYTGADDPLLPSQYVEAMIKALKACSERFGVPVPRFVIEPGRSIVGEAGTTLYTVGAIKDIPGVRKYVSVDGGMNDNPRPALYQAKYTAAIANRAAEKKETVTVAGRCCESGDILIWDAKLQAAHPGDILAVFSTGAYNYSMAGNYNRLPIPAVVLVRDGKAAPMVRRQTFLDLIDHDEIPDWLK